MVEATLLCGATPTLIYRLHNCARNNKTTMRPLKLKLFLMEDCWMRHAFYVRLLPSSWQFTPVNLAIVLVLNLSTLAFVGYLLRNCFKNDMPRMVRELCNRMYSALKGRLYGEGKYRCLRRYANQQSAADAKCRRTAQCPS